ncbi:spermatogenesis-associated protein 5-like [Stylonychia lemnae]|uniref:Spermatogenesis-associated protein 5-like n=1 Tax=Stylonychia lemnae TaxID=5949 RepID=A0A078AWI3_STYLE|nr:spermatogenesis-associated protein 5-like [Stylonychia lemnae]|eukprot:CDW86820.1 spermatogenesis-associated protein 5-like [Stylonychia lemnae]
MIIQNKFQNSQLFLTYLRVTLQQLPNIKEGETLTVQVFGENEQFIVRKVVQKQQSEVENTDQLTFNQVVTKETNIKIKSSNQIDDDGEEEQDELDQLEKMFNSMKINDTNQVNDNNQVQFSGFKEQLELLKEVIELKLLSVENKVNIKGILIHGPSGIGKTMAIENILKGYQLHKIILTPKHLIQAPQGQIKQMQDAFKLLKLKQPSILVVEEIDYIASSKSQNKDLFYAFQSELDSIDSINDKIVVISTTNKLEEVDKSMRRGGRLDIDIRFDMPSAEDRYDILKAHLQVLGENDITDSELEIIGRAASGFVSSDLAQIVRNTHIQSLKFNNGKITKRLLEQAIMDAKPLSIQDLLVEVPKTKWDEIGGNEDIKFQVKQCVEWPLKHYKKFQLMGLKPPAGILLYGPPGCSKTMIAKALATESGLNFIAVKGPELFSKYVGDTEKAIREIFRKARLSSPSIIFFDEIDAMATQRGNEETSVSDRALCQLLNEMDGIESRAQVIVVAATNRLDIIDSALLRPGRFDRLIHVPLPRQEAREQIIRINVLKMQKDEDIDYPKLAQLSEGMSGAEIALICREAGLKALTQDMNIEKEDTQQIKVTQEHLELSLNEVRMRGKADKQPTIGGVFDGVSLFQK